MKTKMYLFAIIACLLCMTSCEKDDLIDPAKYEDCSHLVGKVTTSNGTVPIGGMLMRVYWSNGDPDIILHRTRKKAEVRTAKDGYYDLAFLVREDEKETGYFYVSADPDKDTYLPFHDRRHYEGSQFYKAVIQANYVIPKKATLAIQATNPNQVKPNDYFSFECTHFEGKDGKDACNQGATFQVSPYPSLVEVAAEQPIVMTVHKIKDGVQTLESDTVTLAPGQRKECTYTF